MALVFERFTAAPIGAITLVDRFAQLRGTRGAFPTVVGEIRFLLVAQILGDNTLPFDPPLRLQPQTNPSGVYLFPKEVSIGTTSAVSIPAGRYRLRVEGDFYQTIEHDMNFPLESAEPQTLSLLPGPAYPFPDLTLKQNRLTLLRGSLFEIGPGKPIAGAKVTIIEPVVESPFNSCLTGPNGDWVVAMVLDRSTPPIALTLNFALPGGSSFNVSNVAVLPGTDNGLPQTALRGRVLDTSGTPIPRSMVTVSAQPGQSLSLSDGQWFFYMSMLQDDTQARVTARAPNGRTQEQDIQIRRRATVVVPTFQIAMN
ncbi:MAG TPA: carboxypeptidase-like regulatory domain-containing protein [Blastocatellia bacterium]|nr:carboxypeptidase-like regulatory domain-containing protein [Blastocatellia bacterium]